MRYIIKLQYIVQHQTFTLTTYPKQNIQNARKTCNKTFRDNAAKYALMIQYATNKFIENTKTYIRQHISSPIEIVEEYSIKDDQTLLKVDKGFIYTKDQIPQPKSIYLHKKRRYSLPNSETHAIWPHNQYYNKIDLESYDYMYKPIDTEHRKARDEYLLNNEYTSFCTIIIPLKTKEKYQIIDTYMRLNIENTPQTSYELFPYYNMIHSEKVYKLLYMSNKNRRAFINIIHMHKMKYQSYKDTKCDLNNNKMTPLQKELYESQQLIYDEETCNSMSEQSITMYVAIRATDIGHKAITSLIDFILLQQLQNYYEVITQYQEKA